MSRSVAVAAALLAAAGGLHAGGPWSAPLRNWPPGCCDDYRPKPPPPCPPRAACDVCNYEPKPLPACPPRAGGDACLYDAKPGPVVRPLPCGPLHTCGPPGAAHPPGLSPNFSPSAPSNRR